MESKEIEVVAYNPNWPKFFEKESELLKNTLGNLCKAIHHIGSTAVPGLCSKPKIDILITTNCFEKTTNLLKSIGYKDKGEINIPFHLFFIKKDFLWQINLHLYEEDSEECMLHLLFRDYLRNHPETCLEYANLKWHLLSDPDSQKKTRSRFTGYNLGKDKLIKKILEKTGFNALCFRFCMHDEEKEMVERFQKGSFFEHPDHRHFVLYKGVILIGYAHVELFPNKTASIQFLAIDKPYQNLDFEKYLHNRCLLWIQKEGFTAL